MAEYQVGTGLVSPEFFDWQRHLLGVVAALRPRLVIYMGSANDGQDLFVDGAFQPVGSPLWRKAYADRVAGIMRELVSEGSKVLWIGEPAMQDARLSAYMQVIDQVCAQQAARHHGVTFFDPGAVLNGPRGNYSVTVPVHARPTVVRLDGVHLNMAGSVYLAGYIANYVARIIDTRAAGQARHGNGAVSGVPPGVLVYHFSYLRDLSFASAPAVARSGPGCRASRVSRQQLICEGLVAAGSPGLSAVLRAVLPAFGTARGQPRVLRDVDRHLQDSGHHIF